MERIKFDYSKLNGRIKEKCGSQKVLSKRLNTTQATLSRKLNGMYYFTQDEIMKISGILDIDPANFDEYFFAPKVQKIEQ